MKRVVQLVGIFIIASSYFFSMNAAPSAPINLVAAKVYFQNSINVKLQWQDANPTMGPMNRVFFNIYRKDGSGSDTGSFEKKYEHVEATTWLDMEVHRGGIYSYYVTAVNSSGESAPSDTVQVSLDSAIVKAVITGTVTSSADGKAIANGKVVLIPVMGFGMQDTKTDSTGHFSFHAFAGTYLLYTSAIGFTPEYYNNVKDIFNATKIVLMASDSLNFSIKMQPIVAPKKFKLSGSVKDTAGNPLKAFLEIYSLVHNSFSHRDFVDEHRDYDAVTDSNGNYSVNVNQGDTVVVFARAKNNDFSTQWYNKKSSFTDADRIGISGDVSNVNFVLNHKPVFSDGISGQVHNADSVGVGSIVIAFRISGAVASKRQYSTTSDSLGMYSFVNLVPGKYILLAIPQGDYLPTFFKYDGSQTLRWKNADSVVVDSNSLVSNINFTVIDEPDSGAATVNGVVKDNMGNAIVGAFVFAVNSNQQISSYGITDVNGNYTIAGLVPGSYTISSDMYGYTSAQSSTTSLDYNSAYSSNASFTLTPESVTAVASTPVVLRNYVLNQNYPNPFNPSTVISYTIPASGKVVLKIYNILGSEVATLVNTEQPAGDYKVVFNASNFASGVYFYQIQAGKFVATKKLILMK